MNIVERARKYRAIIERAMSLADDKMASEAPALFPLLTESGALVKAGTRINWHGTVKRAVSDLWDVSENNPDNAPSLWEDIEYQEGYRIIPAVITAAAAFDMDECGWWRQSLYRSKRTANVHTPEQYPAGWEIVRRNEEAAE